MLHNWLTHSLEVAQIAKRIAQLVNHRAPDMVDPNAAEAAALAHDLGHSPFGHQGEKVLCEIIESHLGTDSGFEGNAQSFRIVTRLAQRLPTRDGLNLTRRSLNGLLKYPWLRALASEEHVSRDRTINPSFQQQRAKYGAYSEDHDLFTWVRDGVNPWRRTCEAQIMDYADDIAYSVHDLLDFYKLGVIPLETLAAKDDDWHRFSAMNDQFRFEFGSPTIPLRAYELVRDQIKVHVKRPYDRSVEAQRSVYSFHSTLIGSLIESISHVITPASEHEPALIGPKDESDLDSADRAYVLAQIDVLKGITGVYVHRHPEMKAAQSNQSLVVKSCYEIYFDDANGMCQLMPHWCRYFMEQGQPTARVIGDLVASRTERQLLEMHARICGTSSFTA